MGLSTEGSILSLRMMYGDDHHPTLVGATITIHLGFGDPRDAATPADVELDAVTYPGYAPLALANTSANFPLPAAEGDLTAPPVTICTIPAGEANDWPAAPTHVWTADGSTILDVLALDDTTLPAGGDDVDIDLTMFYDEIVG